jgi:hypothetical protein
MTRHRFKLLIGALWTLMMLPIAPLWAWLMASVPTNRQSSLIFYGASLTFFVVPAGLCGGLA